MIGGIIVPEGSQDCQDRYSLGRLRFPEGAVCVHVVNEGCGEVVFVELGSEAIQRRMEIARTGRIVSPRGKTGGQWRSSGNVACVWLCKK